MRRFFLVWQERVQIFQQPTEKLESPEISQHPAGKSKSVQKGQQAPDELAISQQPVAKSRAAKIFQQPTGKLTATEIPQTPSGQLVILQQPAEKLISAQIRQQAIGKSPFTLSWTHYVLLLTIRDPDERSFYEIEATNAGWSVPELKRQKASCLYERLALSRDKAGIRKLAKEGQVIVRPEDLLKEPLVLKFLGLEEHSYYYDREVKLPDENPTIGLLLCKSAKKTVVELTLPKDANIHAKEYQLYLPSKELLKQKLEEWSAAVAR
ncbi:MAG TPA: hypothetical protein DDZ88_11400 [Verrucomicrobiales bacterium]|nr:hypothetical protein [Verrucomicrobiales bacterium]